MKPTSKESRIGTRYGNLVVIGLAETYGYADELTIERDDVNGNYEPGNCRWIPKSEQNNNKTTTRKINFIGNIVTAAEAERAIGLCNGRINGFRKQYKITHQEAFYRLLCRAVMTTLNAERMVA